MYSRMQDGGGGLEPLRVPKHYDGTALRKSEDLPLCEEKKECEISPPCGQDSPPFKLPFLRSSWLSQILNSDLLLLLLAFLLLSDGDDCRAEEDLPLLLLLLLFIK